jgi:D-3-phosphoglycerate dehydrogenase / 2-oxoglutarate reductase
MQNIIITAPTHPYLIKTLQDKGYTVIYEPSITYTGLLLIINQAKGLVVTTRLKIDKAMLDKATQLQWIGRLGSGMEKIDEVYAAQKNIKCYSTPEGNRQAVAEHTLALLLNLSKNITKSYEEIKEGFWFRKENTGFEISGKTIGIIGYGNNGSAFANLLQPFGVKVLAYDKYKKDFGNNYVTESTIEQITEQASIISFHVPLTSDTEHMVNATFLGSLQQQPILLNVCRGKIIHTQALITALKNETISGAGLDVLENEKIDQLTNEEQQQLNWLLEQTNVIITPHIAGYSHESFFKMSEVLLQKLGII